MKYFAYMVLFACTVFAASCRTEDIRTVEIFIPDMKDEASVRKVMEVLNQVHGVKHSLLSVNPERNSVSVTYNSMKLAIKNIEYAIAGAGFSTYTKNDDGSTRSGIPASAVRKPPAPPAPRKPPAPAPPVGKSTNPAG